MPRFPVLSSILLLLLSATSLLAQPSESEARARQAAETLQQWYDSETGLWKTTSWWNAANALTAIIDYSRLSGDDQYWNVVSNTFDICKEFEVSSSGPTKKRLVRNFITPWYDDEGWWVLVWIDAYDLTGQDRYLEMAKATFADMTTGWDSVCGGGVYWKKPKIGKHAITNGLFLQGAARLHQRSPGGSVNGRTYRQWAWDTWVWLRDSGLVNDQHLVENGLSGDCEVQAGTFYTYNQGVVLGGLIDLSRVMEDETLLQLAHNMGRSTIRKLVYPNGILKDPKEPVVTGDSSQFKGVFMRNLARLYLATSDPELKEFILKNADAVWGQARNPANHQIGALWTGPFDKGDAARQSSGLDALNAALSVAAEGPEVPLIPTEN